MSIQEDINELKDRIAYLERQEDFRDFSFDLLDEKIVKFVEKLIEVVNEHIQDEKSHHYGHWQTDKLKELEGSMQGLTKYLYEKIEELMSKKRKHYKY